VGKIYFYGQTNISQLFLEEREMCFSITIQIVLMVFICHHERFFRVKSTMSCHCVDGRLFDTTCLSYKGYEKKVPPSLHVYTCAVSHSTLL
jgi:hypothetical protein